MRHEGLYLKKNNKDEDRDAYRDSFASTRNPPGEKGPIQCK